MEAEENGANNELLYLSAWSIIDVYKRQHLERALMEIPYSLESWVKVFPF